LAHSQSVSLEKGHIHTIRTEKIRICIRFVEKKQNMGKTLIFTWCQIMFLPCANTYFRFEVQNAGNFDKLQESDVPFIC